MVFDGGTLSKQDLRRTLLRREGSRVLVIKSNEQKEEVPVVVEEKQRATKCRQYHRYLLAFGFVLVFAVPASRELVRSLWYGLASCTLLIFVLCCFPEFMGRALSWALTRFALYDRVSLEFKGLRIVPWFEDSWNSCDQKRVGEEEGEDESESSDVEVEVEVDLPAKCGFLDRWRLCLEVRVRQFSFGNPRGTKWCRERFVTANDVDIVLSATFRDVANLPRLFTTWSWRPRNQPSRPLEDGGGLPFAAIRDKKLWRNQNMLGVLCFEKFEIREIEVAFEQMDGKLNCNEIGTQLARGEARTRYDTLKVDILAARHLDMAVTATGAKKRAPSTFARVSVRGQERRSRTVPRNAAPLYSYEPPQPIAVDDPSAVVFVTVHEEQMLGRAALLGQFATTLKQLVVEPHAVDGALKDSISSSNDGENGNEQRLEKYGWVPLRDAKWRPFDCPRYPDIAKTVDRIDPYAFVDGTSLNTVKVVGDKAPPPRIDFEPRDSEFMRNREPEVAYPALLIRIRWEYTGCKVNNSEAKSGLDNIKDNSAETKARCGCCENVRRMLSSFPFYFHVKNTVKLKKSVLYCRDLFLGVQGELEKKRRASGGRLTEADWRDAHRHAVEISHVNVKFLRRRQRASTSKKKNVVDGVLVTTLDGACARLMKGIVDHVIASPNRVSTSIAHVAAALGVASSLSPRMTRRKMLRKKMNPASQIGTTEIIRRARAASDGTNRLAIALGLARTTFKRFDSRAVEDLNQPCVAVGVLAKLSSGRRWKVYRCVLRGATLFYFRVEGGRRRGEDRAIDLRRTIVNIHPRTPKCAYDDKTLIEISRGVLSVTLRLDDGRPSVFKLRTASVVDAATAGAIDAAAWDADVVSRFQNSPTTSLSAWHNHFLDAVSDARQLAQLEVAGIIEAYGEHQFSIVFQPDEGNVGSAKRKSTVKSADEQRPSSIARSSSSSLSWRRLPSLSAPLRDSQHCPLNGAFVLTRRSFSVDMLCFSEGVTFPSRVVLSAANSKVYIKVVDDTRVFLFKNDVFMPFRFAGPVNRPVKVSFVADRPGVISMCTVSVSDDRRAICLSIASPETGYVFARTEWRLSQSNPDVLERREVWPQCTGISKHSLICNKGADYDEFRRMSPEEARAMELAVVSE